MKSGHDNSSGRYYKMLKYLIYLLILAFLVFPLYWLFTSAIRENKELLNDSISLIPLTFTVQHFYDAIFKVGIMNSFLNSLIITAITVTLSISFGFLMAYVFARFKFAGSNILYSTIVLTQFIPIVAFIIPLYIVMSKLHLLDTYYSLAITYLSSTFPIAVMLLIVHIKDIPLELEEAAMLDGCSTFQGMTKIVFPLCMPGIISTAIFIFITVWQEFLVAVSFISKESAYTVSVGLTKFTTEHGTDWGGLMAGAVIISIPALILFLSTKKMFTESLSGGMKG